MSKLIHSIPELKVIWSALTRRDILPEWADAIVVGGCRDLGLAEKAAELYHAGISRTIITTGYQPSYMDITEAELLADHCIKLNVPAESIILENNAKNTGENIRLSAQLVNEARSVILIHKPYMSLRFLATAEAQWPAPRPNLYAACQDITFEDYCEIHGLEKVAYTMLGDLKRMSVYAELGYQTPQAIADEAHDAFRKLIAAGLEIR
jgi:uncharacterized SAM-binding protein YcdF (DUF218 family)